MPTVDPGALHPLVVHFPIALLLVAPALWSGVLLARDGRPWLTATLVLLAIGTAGAWVAVGTGRAASQLVERSDAVAAVLDRHAAGAERIRTLATVLTLGLAVVRALPWALRRPLPRPVAAAMHGLLLAVYAAAVLTLAAAAHQGGRLVHQLGVRAPPVVAGGG